MAQDYQQLWVEGPKHPVLGYDEVHVWRARLNLNRSLLCQLREILSPDERQRADRYHFQRDREHFVAARGVLRDVLSRYTGAPPESLRFSYSEFGKPSLICDESGEAPFFNISHSDDVAIYAVTSAREVGVDIEKVREDFAGLDIAERFFSINEVAALRALPHAERAGAFFDCWTRKEAYIKARGEGLSCPLHLFTVSLAPGRPAALLHTDDDPQDAARWSMVDLYPEEGFRAALAVKGETPTIRCWRWP